MQDDGQIYFEGGGKVATKEDQERYKAALEEEAARVMAKEFADAHAEEIKRLIEERTDGPGWPE